MVSEPNQSFGYFPFACLFQFYLLQCEEMQTNPTVRRMLHAWRCTVHRQIMSAVWARKAADGPCMYDAYLNASVSGNLSLRFKTEKQFGRDILYATRANVKKRVQKVIHSCDLGGYAFLFFSFPSPPSARRTPSTLSSPLTHRRPHHPHCNSRRPSFC